MWREKRKEKKARGKTKQKKKKERKKERKKNKKKPKNPERNQAEGGCAVGFHVVVTQDCFVFRDDDASRRVGFSDLIEEEKCKDEKRRRIWIFVYNFMSTNLGNSENKKQDQRTAHNTRHKQDG